jgi:hypothetical protein
MFFQHRNVLTQHNSWCVFCMPSGQIIIYNKEYDCLDIYVTSIYCIITCTFLVYESLVSNYNVCQNVTG